MRNILEGDYALHQIQIILVIKIYNSFRLSNYNNNNRNNSN
jgi:hypothetical protein